MSESILKLQNVTMQFGGVTALNDVTFEIKKQEILGYLPDRIRFISDARLLVFGAVLVIMMNLRPDGLLPRKKREKALPEKGSQGQS